MAGRKRITVRERFWEKVKQTETCWLWTAQIGQAFGYGMFQMRRPVYAHRMAWELTNGPIPDGLLVLHKCDVPACVNPSHLFLGTQTDNMRDCAKKGRAPIGERSGAAKLTEEQVKDIRADNRPQRTIAKEYKLCQATVCEIKRREIWRHI